MASNDPAPFQGRTRVFLEHGARGLKSRVEPEERELAEFLIDKSGLAGEWKKSRR